MRGPDGPRGDQPSTAADATLLAAPNRRQASRRGVLAALPAAMLGAGWGAAGVTGVVASVLAAVVPAAPARALAPDLAGALRAGGVVVLVRHARAPGTGDPPGFRLEDCATQRNLNDAGRADAVQLGAALRAAGVPVDTVLTSRWCRARDTARLAFGDIVREAPFLDSFFGNRSDEPQQTAALRGFLDSRVGVAGVAVLVTHQVNITELTGVVPREGEMVVVRPTGGGRFEVLGRGSP